MAKTKTPTLQEQLEAIKKRAQKTSTSNPAGQATQQLENYKTRIGSTGKDPLELTDKRNFIEKGLNLPENQNMLLDVLELLGRPTKALMGGANALVDKAQGEQADIGRSMLQGLTGESKESLKGVLKNLTKSNLGDTEGKWDWIDTIDLAGEVFLDPVDWALIPVTGGASIAADVAKIAGKGQDIAKGVGAAKDAVSAASGVGKIAGEVAEKTVKMKSVSDILFQGAYKGIGKGVKASDNLVSKALKGVSEDNWYRLYNGLKDDARKAFTQGGQKFKRLLRGADSNVDLIRQTVAKKAPKVQDLLERTAKEYGGEVSEDVIGKGIYDLTDFGEVEAGVPQKFLVSELFTEMAENRGIDKMGISTRLIKHTDETYDALVDALKKSDVAKADDLLTVRKLPDGSSVIKFNDEFFDPKNTVGKKKFYQEIIDSADDVEIPVSRYLTEDELKRFAALKADPIMVKAAQEYVGIQDEIYEVLAKFSDVSVDSLKKWSQSNDWRIAHTMNDVLSPEAQEGLKKLQTVFGGNSRVLQTRKWDTFAMEANNISRTSFILAAADGLLKDIPDDLEAAAKVFYGTDMFTRDLKSAFNLFGDVQTESIIRNQALGNVLLMAADSSFADPQLVRVTLGEKIAKDMEVVNALDGRNLAKKLNQIADIYGGKGLAPQLESLAKDLAKGEVAMNKGLLRLIDRNLSNAYTNNVFEVLNKFNNFYKAGKTLSPMFNVTNLGGNLFNMAMSGMKWTEIPQYYTKAHDIIKQIPDIMNKVTSGAILNSDELAKYEIISEFIKDGILGSKGELAPLGLAAKLQDMDTNPAFAGKEAYQYNEEAFKILDKDKEIVEALGATPREIHDHITKQISEVVSPIKKDFQEATERVAKREYEIGKIDEDMIKNGYKQPTEAKTVVEEISKPTVKQLSFKGKNYDTPVEFITDLKKSVKENKYWVFKGQKYERTSDGLKTLLSKVDNREAAKTIKDRLKQDFMYRNFDAGVADSNLNRVLVTDFKLVDLTKETGITEDLVKYYESAYAAKSGDDIAAFSKATLGKYKVKLSDSSEVVTETVTKTVDEPIDGSRLVSEFKGDKQIKYADKQPKGTTYTPEELREVQTNKSWTPEERKAFEAIRAEETRLADESYEALVAAKDPSVKDIKKKDFIKTNKNREKSAAFLREHTLANSLTNKEKAIQAIVDKLDAKTKQAFLSGDGEQITKALYEKVGKDHNPLNQLIKLNMKANSSVDSYSRMAMYLKAVDDPKFMEGLGVNSPMDAVRLALFDPSDLSYFEESTLKKLIPFYTFTKKNLVYQMENLARHSSKYHRLYKGIRKSWENSGISWESLPEYQMNNMYIPIPSVDDEGNYSYIRLNLPFSDAVEFASDPIRRMLSSFTPAVRAPFEIATNKQIFTGQPISEYEGQMNKQIPFLDNKAAYGLSQLGWDVPLRSMTQGGQAVLGSIDKLKSGQSLSPLDFTKGMNLSNTGNVQTNLNNQMYEDLQSVKDYVTKIKAAGQTLPTLDEISNPNSVVEQLKAKLSKYK